MQSTLNAPGKSQVVATELTDVRPSAVLVAPREPVPLPGTIPELIGPRHYELPKRGIDLLLGTIGLVVTGLVALVVVPMILLKSPGAPPVFKQTRVGRGGKPFTCYKFRSMKPDAEARKAELAALNEADGPVFKMKNDPRQIDGMSWIRKFSIDEMPQFLNVIEGDMSLVGPRPPDAAEVPRYTPHQLQRLAVKPGLTCTWQVEGRSRIGFTDWVEMDLEYIERRSTLLDLELLVRTIPAVISARGAV